MIALITREVLSAKRDKRRKEHRKKLFFSLAICFLIAFVSLGVYVGFNFSFTHKTDKSAVSYSSLNKSAEEKNSKPSTVLPSLQKDMTVMLLGVDERNKDVGRSDTLMFVSFSGDKASLLSIPRDTRVYIERRGYDKINAAYAQGGEELTRSTVEDFLGVKVDRYVKVNIAEFMEIIDAVGGIDIVVEKTMDYEDPWDDNGGLSIHLDKGLQHLDGKTAMEYVRYRDAEGDAGRVRRQQAFMQACAERLSDPTIILKLPQILSVTSKAVETDLSSAEMLAIAGSLKSAEDANHIKTGTVPGYWQYISGVSYLVPDPLRLGEIMTQNLGIDADERHFEKLARNYPAGAAYNYYDVNQNLSEDLKIMDAVERNDLDLSVNDL